MKQIPHRLALTIGVLIALAGSVPIWLVGLGLVTNYTSLSIWGVDYLTIVAFASITAIVFYQNAEVAGMVLPRVADRKPLLWLRVQALSAWFSLMDFAVSFLFCVSAFGRNSSFPSTVQGAVTVITVFSFIYLLGLVIRIGLLSAFGMGYTSIEGFSGLGMTFLASMAAAMLRKGDRRGFVYLAQSLEIAIDSYADEQLHSKSLDSALVSVKLLNASIRSVNEDELMAARILADATASLPDSHPLAPALEHFLSTTSWAAAYELKPEAPRTRYEAYAVAGALIAAVAALVSDFFSPEVKQNVLTFVSSSLLAEVIVIVFSVYLSSRIVSHIFQYLVPWGDMNAVGA